VNNHPTQSSLIKTIYPDAPRTEGIKYAGSKLKLLPHILWLASKTNAKTVFDGFSGSTRVSQAFARYGYEVISNDKAIWSGVIGQCYLKGGEKIRYKRLIDHLNMCKPEEGWFTRHYGGNPPLVVGEEPTKMPWQTHNTRKLDAIRREIDRLNLDKNEKSVAVTSLIMALDRVDSTLVDEI